MNKAIFLDRDGTINFEKNYLYKINDFEFLPRTIDALKMLQDAGYMLIVVTNQSGIARGLYTERDFQLLTEWMKEQLALKGIYIEKTYFCPHHPKSMLPKYKKECACRKPAIGMYSMAIKELDIDMSLSYAIGDRLRDCAICEVTECRGFLVGATEDETVRNLVVNQNIQRVKYAADLYEAACEIVDK